VNRQPSLYVNGVLVRTGVTSINNSIPSTGLGGAASGYGNYSGLLDEVSIYNRPLSAAEIQSIYFASGGGKCAIPPVIFAQPGNLTALAGSTASFSVSAGGARPLNYQWQLNGTNIPVMANSTATNPTLVLPNVQTSQSGNVYSVLVTNVVGFSNSTSVQLTVLEPGTCIAPPSGMVSWWAGEGSAADSFGTNNGALVNGAGFAAGEVGRAFSLDGSSQYVDVMNSATLNPTGSISLEAWIYPTQFPPSAPIIKKAGEGSAQQDGYGIEIDNSGLLFGVYVNGSWTLTGAASVPLNQWSHVAGVYDGTNLSLYVNGSLAVTQVHAVGQITPSGNDLQIGHDPANASRYFGGLIDEAAVYNTPLSADQIQAIYTVGSAGKCGHPPVIVSQPASPPLITGQNAAFSVTATGAAPLSYQWEENATNIPAAINATASNATLILTNVQLGQSGNIYSVVVSNAFGTTNSVGAMLTVNSPVIPSTGDLWDIHQGSIVTDTSGAHAPNSDIRDMFGGAFSQTEPGHTIFADGHPPGFVHWVDWQTIAPVTVSSFNLFAVGDGPSRNNDREFVQFVLKAKSSAMATNYDLTLYTLVITNHPYSFVDAPHQALLAANITPVTAQYFRAEFTQYNAGVGFDGPRIIELDGFGSNALTILSQPQSQSETIGGNAIFTVSAIGTPPLGFQWQVNGTNISPASNATATNFTLVLTNVQTNLSGNQYSAVVTSFDGSTNSSNAMLTIVNSQTHYADVNGTNPSYPFTSWATAATNIQDAVDAAVVPDQVLVTNGIYQYGGRIVQNPPSPFSTSAPTNRLVVTSAITVQSVNGPAATVIQGYKVPGTTSGPSAVRCVYMANGAQLIGFTLANGGTLQSQLVAPANNGAGVYCPSDNATLYNCVIDGNAASGQGGGAYGCILINCTLAGNACIASPRFGATGGGAASCKMTNCIITNNIALAGGGTANSSLINCTLAGNFGGASYQDTMTNCTLTGNWANNGGGADQSTLNFCTVTSNFATNDGGGAYQGTLNYCILSANIASSVGGGAYQGTLNSCVVSGNTAGVTVGGVASGVLNNCLIVSNSTPGLGFGSAAGEAGGTNINCTIAFNSGGTVGGIRIGILKNCLVYSNTGSVAPNYQNVTPNFCCTTPLPTNGTGNITNIPLFVNPAGGDFHLQSNSPCINAGYNPYVSTTNDLDGNPRISGGTVDIGAYEFQNPASIISYAWLQQYGLPTDGSADFIDSDHNGMNNWQKWIAGLDPTNPLSVLQMLSPTSTTNPPGLVVTWQSVANHNYFLQRATNLSIQPSFQPLATNLSGQAGTTSYTDTNAPAPGPYFYRVGVQQ
jgi:hypothetical protein